jgi:hypothetical protein
MATTSIGTNTVSAGNTVAVTVGAGGVPAGALIVVFVADSSTTASGGLCAVADSKGNTYINGAAAGVLQSIGASNASGGSVFFYCYNATALVNGDTITYTLQQIGKNAAISALYATGIQTASDPKDTTANTQGSSTAPSSGATTPSIGGDLILGYVATDGPPTDTFTQDSTNGAYATPPVRVGVATTGPTVAGGSLVQGAAAAITYAPTLGTSRNWRVRVISFKAVAPPSNGSFFPFF